MTPTASPQTLENSEKLLEEEINLLRSYANQEQAEINSIGKDDCKTQIAAALRIAFWKKHGQMYSQTSCKDGYSTLNHAGTSFSYGYQRFDLTTRADKLTFAYGIHNQQDKFASTGLFCSSGMAAISSFFEAIEHTGMSDIEMPNDPYFETSLLAAELKQKKHPQEQNQYRWIYLDSISKTNPLEMLPTNPADSDTLCVVADTTCWRRVSDQMAKLLEWSLQNSVPVVLLRSHLKLDFLGLDSGRLGSLIALYPAGTKREKIRYVKSIFESAQARVLRTGRNFRAEDIPVYWGDERFDVLSDKRFQRIQNSIENLFQTITRRDSNLSVTMPDHRLFLLLKGKSAGKERAQKIAEQLRKNHFKAIQASGFGFDSFAVDAYFDGATREEVIRLAPGVYSLGTLSDAERIVQCL